MAMAMTFVKTCLRRRKFIEVARSMGRSSEYEKILSNSSRTIWSSSRDGTCIIPTTNKCVRFSPAANWSLTTRRNIWGWLNAIFNKVDESRIKEVGPDRACAEWLLRCGAFVKWQNKDGWTKDYNTLPVSGGRALKIEEVDATDSAIMHIGFPHFKGCKHIKRMVFHKALYLEDAGMSLLPLLQESLKELQVSSCGNVTVEGLRHIKKLKNLESLLLYDLPEIRNKDAMQKELQDALPKCTVLFPYAQPEDDPSLKTEEEKKGT